MAQIDLKVTSPDHYTLTFTPLDDPAHAYIANGTLATPGEPIDWIEFTFFNTDSDNNFDTDFFIKSMEIFNDAAPGVPGDYNNNGKVDGTTTCCGATIRALFSLQTRSLA